MYRDRLAIPYVTPSGTVSIRYRSVPSTEAIAEAELLIATGDRDKAMRLLKESEAQPKYMSMPGEPSRLFNASALKRPETFVCVCEGELDAITAASAGLPAVGLPGANAWEDVFARCLRWYRAVYVLADADDKGVGLELGKKIAAKVSSVSIIPMPTGHDVNSFVAENGPEALRDRIGV